MIIPVAPKVKRSPSSTAGLWLRPAQVALETDNVVRFLKPGDQFIVEVGLGSDADIVSPPPRPIVDGLDDSRTVKPAMRRKAGQEPVLAGLKPAESDPCDADQAGLLRDDLNIAEGVEQRDVPAR